MKISKKKIQTILRTLNLTLIHKMVHDCGLDANKHHEVMGFIRMYAPSEKVYSKAYSLSYGRAFNKQIQGGQINHSVNLPIKDALNFAKTQVNEGFSNYTKILQIGNRNIYWVSPIYGHSDYNKSIAMPNNPKNRRVAILINQYMINQLNSIILCQKQELKSK